MRVAFYAPLKSPTHPSPSGDRRMARLLMRALRLAGHDAILASRVRAYDRTGDASVQASLAERGGAMAQALIRRWQNPNARRPQAWFTYHLYHKSPDHLGPAVSAALRIPYVVAEPSVAPKQREGRWAGGYRASLEALGQADAALCLNTADTQCVRPALKPGARLELLPPFLETAPFTRAARKRDQHRRALAKRLKDAGPFLLAVGMMRPGDKLESYRALARALQRVADRPWHLVIAGDGAARAEVEAAFASLKERVTYLGMVGARTLPAIYAGCDLYVWPAVREAYGMAMLEAQAAGLPVVAGRGVGVSDVVADGKTGILVASDDDAAFAAAVASLLDDAARRNKMAQAALERVAERHDIAAAARLIDATLRLAARRIAA